MKNVLRQFCWRPVANALPGIFAVLTASVFSLPAVQADQTEDWKMSANVGYEGRYVEWGEQELDSGGLFTVGFGAEKDGLTFGLRLADAEDEDYQKIALSFGYEWYVTGDLEAEIHLEREDSFEDSEHGHSEELEASLSYELANWTASLEYAYTTESDGGALALGLSGEYEIGGFGIHPAVELVRDWGYIGENTLSSAQLQLGISRKLSETLLVTAWLTHQIALNSLREEYHSLAWGGIDFTASF